MRRRGLSLVDVITSKKRYRNDNGREIINRGGAQEHDVTRDISEPQERNKVHHKITAD